MFLQFLEPALGRTRFTRKDSVTLTESFGIGMSRAMGKQSNGQAGRDGQGHFHFSV